MRNSELNHEYGVFEYQAIGGENCRVVACTKCGAIHAAREIYMQVCDGKMNPVWGVSFLNAKLLQDVKPWAEAPCNSKLERDY